MSPEERRAAILDALVPLLEKHGPQVTTRQIAEAAGIAEGTIFRAFPDKRTLFLEAARLTVAPPGWRDRMAAEAAQHADLRGKVLTAVDGMVLRSRRLFLAMAALRGAVLTGTQPPAPRGGPPPGVPPFLVEAGRELLEALTELVFEPHRDELCVPPDRAARALRSLVTGTWHPGATEADRLTSVEITDVLLHGVAATCGRDGKPCC
jgi:AcrR family transcriptional regulator